MNVELPFPVLAGICLICLLAGLLIGGWPAEVLHQRDAARADRARLQEQHARAQAENLDLGQRARRAEKAYAAIYTWAYGVPPADDPAPPAAGGDTAA